jgi:SulP family sulfate permease
MDISQKKKNPHRLDYFPLYNTIANYRRDFLTGDVVAALNVALLAFPQGIAYAIIAGMPLAYGLFGSIIAALIGGFFSKSTYVALGPTNATAVLLLSALVAFPTLSAKLSALPMIVILSGIVLIIGAHLRVSGFIRFVSRTVITGYITAAAALIILNQLRTAMGIRLGEDEVASTFFKAMYYSLLHLNEVNIFTLCFSVITLMLFLSLKRYFPKLPNVAITLIVMSLFGIVWSQWVEPLVLLQSISFDTWSFTPPPIDYGIASAVFTTSIAIAMLSVLEGNSIGRSLAARAGKRFNADQEIFSMGIANIGCGLFSGIPASGSLTRSALNVNSGAKTPFASILTGMILLAGVLLIGEWIRFIPQAALAVIIIMIGISLIDFAAMRFVSMATREDAITFAITLATGLIVGLDTAIYSGVLVSILLFLRNAASIDLIEFDFDEGGELVERRNKERTVPEVSIVHVEGDLFFGASDLLQNQIRRIAEDPNLKVVILRLRNARHIDATSAMALMDLLRWAEEKKRALIVCGVRKNAFRTFYRTGLIHNIGKENFFMESAFNPVASTAKAIQRARHILGNDKANVSLFVANNRKYQSNQNDLLNSSNEQ